MLTLVSWVNGIQSGRTALTYAVLVGRLDIVKYLVFNGADVNVSVGGVHVRI
jgi:ankyrin repeat protein